MGNYYVQQDPTKRWILRKPRPLQDAKLTAPTPADASKWKRLNERLRVHHTRQHLLVTNRGPREEGYTYCTKCGLIEPTANPKGTVGAAHRKLYPDIKESMCPGGGATKGLVLGTDFITDVLLVAIRVEAPITLVPGVLATDVALRTICVFNSHSALTSQRELLCLRGLRTSAIVITQIGAS
jgi:hypothetical protein